MKTLVTVSMLLTLATLGGCAYRDYYDDGYGRPHYRDGYHDGRYQDGYYGRHYRDGDGYYSRSRSYDRDDNYYDR